VGSGDENQGQRRYLASYQVSLLPNLILWVRKGKETSEIGQARLVGLEKARDMPDVMRRDSPASGFRKESYEREGTEEIKEDTGAEESRQGGEESEETIAIELCGCLDSPASGFGEDNMPIYEYLCTKCGTEFELRRPFSEADKLATCPKCNSEAQKMLSNFASKTGSYLQSPSKPFRKGSGH